MLKKMLFFCFFLCSIWVFISDRVSACEMCTVTHIGRDDKAVMSESKDHKWFFKYLFEQQVWKTIPAEEAHELHHDGQHVHDKTKEEFHHLSLGRQLTDDASLTLELPIVNRKMVEIEDHDRLGESESSQGIGDMSLIGNLRIFHDEHQSVSFVAGVKTPTGQTHELNSVGERFEPEMQPGTGSYDYIFGGVYNSYGRRLKFIGNSVYVMKTEGSQDYQFGDLFSASAFLDYVINPDSSLKAKVGIASNFQYEQKHKNSDGKIEDSGGTILLIGPSVSLESDESVSMFGSILFPVSQDMGGVHQKIDYTWTAGAKVNW